MTENKMFYCTGEVVNGKQIFVLKRHSTPNLGKEMTKQVRFEMTERVRSNSEHLESGNTLLPIEEFTTKTTKDSPKHQLIKSAQLISIYLLLGTVGIGVEILCNYYAVMDCYEHTARQYLYQLLAFVSASLSIISALASYVALFKAWRKLFKSIRGVNEMRKTLMKELASENPDSKQLKRKFLNNLRHLLIQSILIIAATCLVAYLGHHQQIKYVFLCSQLAYKFLFGFWKKMAEDEQFIGEDHGGPPPLNDLSDFVRINDRLRDIMYETVGLVGLFVTTAGISVNSEQIVHSRVIGACNDTTWYKNAEIAAVFGFGFVSIIGCLASVVAIGCACWKFLKSYRFAYQLYQTTWRLALTGGIRENQIKKRHANFFKHSVKEIIAISGSTFAVAFFGKNESDSIHKKVHSVCHGNALEWASWLAMLLNKIYINFTLVIGYLSLLAGFVAFATWLHFKYTKPFFRRSQNEISDLIAIGNSQFYLEPERASYDGPAALNN
ncbi:hypothetical protein M3Y97_01144200 [Aphelenchoides bicaudatus]|nr:hypothetical protein M3Y97_01144200 [Aphelenchoides bicaudatus]